MNRFLLNLGKDAASQPTIAKAVLETGVLVNILVADIDFDEGSALISVQGGDEQVVKIVSYLKEHGVEVREVTGAVRKDDDKCIDCGACFSVCPTKAITLSDNLMVLDNQECISCGACVPACPVGALCEEKV